jgi:hypothetical protein
MICKRAFHGLVVVFCGNCFILNGFTQAVTSFENKGDTYGTGTHRIPEYILKNSAHLQGFENLRLAFSAPLQTIPFFGEFNSKGSLPLHRVTPRKSPPARQPTYRSCQIDLQILMVQQGTPQINRTPKTTAVGAVARKP